MEEDIRLETMNETSHSYLQIRWNTSERNILPHPGIFRQDTEGYTCILYMAYTMIMLHHRTEEHLVQKVACFCLKPKTHDFDRLSTFPSWVSD